MGWMLAKKASMAAIHLKFYLWPPSHASLKTKAKTNLIYFPTCCEEVVKHKQVLMVVRNFMKKIVWAFHSLWFLSEYIQTRTPTTELYSAHVMAVHVFCTSGSWIIILIINIWKHANLGWCPQQQNHESITLIYLIVSLLYGPNAAEPLSPVPP